MNVILVQKSTYNFLCDLCPSTSATKFHKCCGVNEKIIFFNLCLIKICFASKFFAELVFNVFQLLFLSANRKLRFQTCKAEQITFPLTISQTASLFTRIVSITELASKNLVSKETCR